MQCKKFEPLRNVSLHSPENEDFINQTLLFEKVAILWCGCFPTVRPIIQQLTGFLKTMCTLITCIHSCRRKMTSIVLRKTQESFCKVVISLHDHVIKFKLYKMVIHSCRPKTFTKFGERLCPTYMKTYNSMYLYTHLC